MKPSINPPPLHYGTQTVFREMTVYYYQQYICSIKRKGTRRMCLMHSLNFRFNRKIHGISKSRPVMSYVFCSRRNKKKCILFQKIKHRQIHCWQMWFTNFPVFLWTPSNSLGHVTCYKTSLLKTWFCLHTLRVVQRFWLQTAGSSTWMHSNICMTQHLHMVVAFRHSL